MGSVKVLAEKLPRLLNIDVYVLRDEWRQYQLEESVDSFIKDPGGTVRRVDHYWRDVFQIVSTYGVTLKYGILAVFVKSLLVT